MCILKNNPFINSKYAQIANNLHEHKTSSFKMIFFYCYNIVMFFVHLIFLLPILFFFI